MLSYTDREERKGCYMILAIDTGNTHTVLGCIDEKKNPVEVHQVLRMRTDPQQTEFEYAIKIKQIFNLSHIQLEEFDGAIVSSVVPRMTGVLAEAVRLVTGKEPLILGSGVKTGLAIMLDDPGTIAADLVATAVAAKEEYPLPAVIIDMGTATTITVVDKEGRYIGGAIMPGAGISLQALTAKTSLLPSVDIIPPRKTIASNTVDAIKAGIVFGQAGAIDGTLDRFAEALGEEPATIVTTGGMGEVIAPNCRHAIQIDGKLLLKGLGIIWKKNQGTEKKRARAGAGKTASGRVKKGSIKD